MKFREILCVSVAALFGFPASATCLSYYGDCPFDVGDPDSAADFLENFPSSIYNGRYASIDPNEDPTDAKRLCILTCHRDFKSSEQACLALPDTQTESGNLRTVCLDQALHTFNECIHTRCGINY